MVRQACVLASVVVLGCGEATVRMSDGDALNGAPFVRVTRSALTQLGDAGTGGVTTSDAFYIAIHKSQLGQPWFLSAYLTQWHPSENVPMRSLGTRVVTFQVQNGKVFVFDATRGRTWSDTLDPSVLVEAYPLVTDYAPFNALPNSSQYVLIDPAAGLNRFSVVSDDFAERYWARFQVDLAYLQNFRELPDGVSFEEVFTGYTEVPGPGVLAYEQPFRGSGTLRMTLRRYGESAGFAATPFTERQYFPSSNWQYVKDQPRSATNTIKWNIHPGMQPIQWRISQGVAALQNDPRLAGIDVVGAIRRGVEGWNSAFGFEVFQVVPTGANDSPGDDDKNFIVVDKNPGAGLAFANWRENPNTGEIRGASVYFSSVFVEAALQEPGGAPDDAGTPFDGGVIDVDAGSIDDGGFDGGVNAPCSPELVISQVFGGNSTSGSYGQDYVELHNRSSQPVSLAGLSLQYGSATGTSWQVLPLSGTVSPNGFFLVGLARTSDGGVPLPSLDQSSSLALSATSGKVALVNSLSALSGACPVTPQLVDLVGYGAANCAEGTAAPTLSNTRAAVRAGAGCTDTQDNAADFTSETPNPRNSSSLPEACVCSAPTPMPGPVTADGGVQLVRPTSRPSLSWDALATGSTCALEAPKALIPEGMTRRQYVENVITHTILHEVGHTLGLRHNFKGSLAGMPTSVMDYLRDDQGSLMTAPGAYDVDAVRHLYLGTAAPTETFCTDEDLSVDAECDIWDASATPLTSDVGPRFTAAVRGTLSEVSGLTYGQIHTVTRYVRGPSSEAQRLEAFNLLMGDVAPPLRSDVLALGPNAGPWADLLARAFLQNLFVDSADWRDGIGVDPSLADPTFHSRVVTVTKNILVNSDGYRSFESRRMAVDVLKAMQSYDAYNALVTARPTLVSQRAGTTNTLLQAVLDDLIKRLDVACTPYFR